MAEEDLKGLRDRFDSFGSEKRDPDKYGKAEITRIKTDSSRAKTGQSTGYLNSALLTPR